MVARFLRLMTAAAAGVIACGWLLPTGVSQAASAPETHPLVAAPPPLAWSTPVPTGAQYIFSGSLSCPTAQFCASVDESGRVHVFNGAHWRKPVFLGFNAADNWAVSCPTAKWCAASDGYGHVSYYYNGTWSALQQVKSLAAMSIISCASYRFCASAGFAGFDASTYNGRAWSTPVTIDPGTNGIAAISCPASSLCMAVDGSGNAIQFNGKRWLKPRLIDASAYLDAIDCPTTKLCLAVDSRGGLITWNGRSWGHRQRIDGIAYLSAIECSGTSFCLAADGQGNFIQVIGKRYVQHVKHFFFTVALSCASTAFCAAVNEGGQAIVGKPPAKRRR